MFDQDGNGVIDLAELKLAMSGVKIPDEEWKEILLKYDANSDGVVNTIFPFLSLFSYLNLI